jgi:hypothetical protein
VHGGRCEVCALSVVIRVLEFEPVGPQNRWVDVMFLTLGSCKQAHVRHCCCKAPAHSSISFTSCLESKAGGFTVQGT